MATASPRVALDLDGVVLDRLWLEGSGQDTATGEAVVEVKLGLRLPLRGLIEALTELQRAHPRTQPDSPPPRAKLPEQPFVVSKTFVEHDQPDSPQRTALLRTSTAPPELRERPGRPRRGRRLGAVEEELESEDAVGHSAGAAGIGCRTATFDPMEHDADDAAERPAWEPPEGAGDPVYPTQAQNELAYTGIPPMYPFVPVPVPVPVPADACHNWFPHWQQPDQPALPTTRPLGTLATDREESPARPRKPEMESLLDDTGLLRVIADLEEDREEHGPVPGLPENPARHR
ncbi:unnamed protein product [Prorocentrum cordatum]|uniref:Uncharacterized protein n=1 Tax=Prorocentrum cordatum TaxID=2364126 RepID=A0ABN9WIC3_9DINO|nr:unnamed protein product [Polarella glacialis]